MCSKYLAVPVLIRGDKIICDKNIGNWQEGGQRIQSHTDCKISGTEMFHELKIVSVLYHGTDVYSRHWRVYNLFSEQIISLAMVFSSVNV